MRLDRLWWLALHGLQAGPQTPAAQTARATTGLTLCLTGLCDSLFCFRF
jgi:hypothetical protein